LKNLIIILLLTGPVFTASAQRSKKASEIFKEYLAAVSSGNTKAAASFFTDSGYIEAPYVAALGMPSRFQGHEAIEATMAGVRKLAPDFHLPCLRCAFPKTTNKQRSKVVSAHFFQQIC
jgi:hypothetical protein